MTYFTKRNHDSIIFGLSQLYTPDSGRAKVDPSNTSTSFGQNGGRDGLYELLFDSLFPSIIDGASTLVNMYIQPTIPEYNQLPYIKAAKKSLSKVL